MGMGKTSPGECDLTPGGNGRRGAGWPGWGALCWVWGHGADLHSRVHFLLLPKLPSPASPTSGERWNV